METVMLDIEPYKLENHPNGFNVGGVSPLPSPAREKYQKLITKYLRYDARPTDRDEKASVTVNKIIANTWGAPR